VGMKSKLIATTALTSTALIPAAVLAADLRMPVKAPPVAPPFAWNGCYVGLNAGGASVRLQQRIVLPNDPAIESSERDNGFTGGGQIGCNVQYAPNWAFGVEGDINYIGAKHGFSTAFDALRGEDSYGVTGRTRLRWLGTLRGRLGPTWGHSFLYATGGLAVGHVNSSVDAVLLPSTPFSGSSSSTRSGWVVGAGFEHAFTSRISGKIEYLHFDLGKTSFSVIGPVETWNVTTKVSGDIIRAGLNFRF